MLIYGITDTQNKPLIDKINRDEKLAKSNKLKQHEDFEKESEIIHEKY